MQLCHSALLANLHWSPWPGKFPFGLGMQRLFKSALSLPSLVSFITLLTHLPLSLQQAFLPRVSYTRWCTSVCTFPGPRQLSPCSFHLPQWDITSRRPSLPPVPVVSAEAAARVPAHGSVSLLTPSPPFPLQNLCNSKIRIKFAVFISLCLTLCD